MKSEVQPQWTVLRVESTGCRDEAQRVNGMGDGVRQSEGGLEVEH